MNLIGVREVIQTWGVGRKVKREGNDVIIYFLPKKNKYKCLRQECA